MIKHKWLGYFYALGNLVLLKPCKKKFLIGKDIFYVKKDSILLNKRKKE